MRARPQPEAAPLRGRPGVTRKRLYTGPAAETTDAPSMPLTDEQWLERVHGWWEQDRARRIRAGACPRCGEKKCPRVGGGDRECVL
jgi:hypothetical protein